MKLKLLTAALALSLAAAPALAQTSGTGAGAAGTSGGGAPAVETDQNMTASTGNSAWTEAERTLYGESDMWAGFYTDETMGTLKSESEIQAQFSAMGADDQAGMKAACDRVNSDRGSYGSVTTGLCAQIGQM